MTPFGRLLKNSCTVACRHFTVGASLLACVMLRGAELPVENARCFYYRELAGTSGRIRTYDTFEVCLERLTQCMYFFAYTPHKH